jgi:uncharacterized membrane-anchored protein YitT (DUF2179 family)
LAVASFFTLLNTAGINSQIIFRESNGGQNIIRKFFSRKFSFPTGIIIKEEELSIQDLRVLQI